MSAATGTYDGSGEREGTCWRRAPAWMVHIVWHGEGRAGL